MPVVAAILGSLLPDIDTPKSKLGSKFLCPITEKPVSSHRGFTHSIVGMLLIVGIIGIPLQEEITKYVAIGYLSHLMADMLNPGGVPLLWPKKDRFRIPIINTGSTAEKYILYPIVLLYLARCISKTAQ